MRKTILHCLLLLSGVLFCPPNIWGQTTAFQAEFSTFTSRSYGSNNWIQLEENDEDYPNWTFDNCYARSEGSLYVASNRSSGSFNTPSFSISDNTRIKLIVKNDKNDPVSFSLTSSSGTLTQSEFTIPKNTNSYNIITHLYNASPNTRLTISAAKSNGFYLKSLAVINIQKIFHETFSMMPADKSSDFELGEEASAANCDNSGAEMSSNVMEAYRSIYLKDEKTCYYKMPAISITEGKRHLLSFRLAGDNGLPILRIECDGDTKLSPFNSYDVSTAASSQEEYFRTITEYTWCDYYVVVTGMTSSTRISFYGENIFLDEVMLTEIPSNLDQTKDNSLFIDAYAGETRDVTLSRTLTPNIWCPLCLPFDVTPAKMAADMDVACEVRTLTSISDGVFTFDAVESSTTVTAGTPFLVKVPSAVVNPTLTSVVVSTTTAQTASASTSDYKFIGTYSPVELNTNGTHLFLGTDGKLYKPSTGAGENLLGGLRAYFEVPAAAQSARIMINDEVSAVEDVRTATSQQLFDLYGRQISNHSPKRDLYIVRPAEGRLQGKNGKKIIVK